MALGDFWEREPQDIGTIGFTLRPHIEGPTIYVKPVGSRQNPHLQLHISAKALSSFPNGDRLHCFIANCDNHMHVSRGKYRGECVFLTAGAGFHLHAKHLGPIIEIMLAAR